MAHLQHLATQPPTVRPLPRSMVRLGWSDEAWPDDAVQAFSLRMADHGMSVSTTLMRRNPRYALEQLRHAHSLADDDLRELAVELFRDFERRRPDPAAVS